MDPTTSNLMNVPMTGLMAHVVRTQISQMNAMRAVFSLLGHEKGYMAYQQMNQYWHNSVGTVFADIINGRGAVAMALRQMASAQKGRPDQISMFHNVEEQILAKLPKVRTDHEGDPTLSQEYHSRVNVQFGVNSQGIWNHEELDRLYAEGKIKDLKDVQVEDCAVFRAEDETTGEVTYGMRLYLTEFNRSLLTIVENANFVSGATYVELEDVWAPHDDVRLVSVEEIDRKITELLAEIGVTEIMPAVEPPAGEEEQVDAEAETPAPAAEDTETTITGNETDNDQ